MIYDETVDTAVIDRLLEPYARLDSAQLRLTSIYIDLLVKWNARINLTAIRDPQEIVTRHFGESFFAARQLLSRGPWRSVIDLGSGAGFPGIPLAMLMTESRVTLIESNQKKATFLKEVIFALELDNATVFHGRGETCAEQADLVIMRAVEKFEDSLEVASNLARPNGTVALMIGASQVSRARAVVSNVEWIETVQIPGSESRILLVGIKRVKVG